MGDCGCDFQTVNQANHQYFYPLLQELIKKTFFQYFKVTTQPRGISVPPRLLTNGFIPPVGAGMGVCGSGEPAQPLPLLG